MVNIKKSAAGKATDFLLLQGGSDFEVSDLFFELACIFFCEPYLFEDGVGFFCDLGHFFGDRGVAGSAFAATNSR